jgi:hypothetical protein
MASQPEFHWVLRCAITGDAFASQDDCPKDVDMPVEHDFRECYWAKERTPQPKTRPVETCRTCGSDAWNGVCEYNTDHVC